MAPRGLGREEKAKGQSLSFSPLSCGAGVPSFLPHGPLLPPPSLPVPCHSLCALRACKGRGTHTRFLLSSSHTHHAALISSFGIEHILSPPLKPLSLSLSPTPASLLPPSLSSPQPPTATHTLERFDLYFIRSTLSPPPCNLSQHVTIRTRAHTHASNKQLQIPLRNRNLAKSRRAVSLEQLMRLVYESETFQGERWARRDDRTPRA